MKSVTLTTHCKPDTPDTLFLVDYPSVILLAVFVSIGVHRSLFCTESCTTDRMYFPCIPGYWDVSSKTLIFSIWQTKSLGVQRDTPIHPSSCSSQLASSPIRRNTTNQSVLAVDYVLRSNGCGSVLDANGRRTVPTSQLPFPADLVGRALYSRRVNLVLPSPICSTSTPSLKLTQVSRSRLTLSLAIRAAELS